MANFQQDWRKEDYSKSGRTLKKKGIAWTKMMIVGPFQLK